MIGIYKLQFSNKYAYIGQSIDLTRRKKQHIYGMTSGKHYNSSIIQAFKEYGEPEFFILEECTIEQLNARELHYASIEDLPLLNRAPLVGTSDPQLILHHNKKYSKEQILKVAELLVDRHISFKDIETITEVNSTTVAAISMGHAHNWLKESVPQIYSKMLELKGTRQRAKSKKFTQEQIYEILVYLGNPKLTIKEISEITEISVPVIQSISARYAYTDFAELYPVEYKNMLEASKLRGHKEQLTVISPEGEVFSVINRSEFARKNGMRKASFLDLCNKKIASYKGWTIQDL